MATPDLEITAGLSSTKALQEMARLEASARKAAKEAEDAFLRANPKIAKSYTQMMDRMQRSTAQTMAAINKHTATGAAAARGNLQNVSYQLQDIFVQISSGQGAARALGQQLPQLLSGFGALGAALGLAASAAIPLAASLMGAEEEAIDLDKAVGELAAALEALRAAQQNAAIPVDALIEKYGALADEMGRVFQNQLAIARQELEAMGKAIQDAMAETANIDAMVSRFDALKTAVDAGVISYEEYRAQLLDNERAFGLTNAQALQYQNLMEAVASASGPEEQAQAWLAVHDWIEASRTELEAQGVAVDDMLQQTNDLAGAYAKSHAAAADAATAAEAGAAATDSWAAVAANLAANLQGAAGAAGQAAAALGALIAEQNKLAGMELGKLGGMDQFSPSAGRAITAQLGGMNAPQQYELDRSWKAQLEAAEEAARRAARGSGGGGRARGGGGGRSAGTGGSKRTERPLFEDIERDLIALQRQIELLGKSNEEIATAKARWELLDEAKKRGLPLNDQLNAQINAQAAEVGRLTGELDRAEIAQAQFEETIDGIAGAMADALTGGQSLREGLAQVFKGIASDILKSGIQNALRQAFNLDGSGGGWLSGLFGLFGGGVRGNDVLSQALRGAIGFRALGGPISAGSPYIVGERGPELIIPRSPGQVIPNHQLESRGAGQMTIVIDVRGATGNEEVQRMVAAGVAQGMAQMDKALPARVAQINRNPRMR